MKQVSKKEFDTFITNYPRKLEKSGWNDVRNYNDFSLGDIEVATVARINFNLFPDGEVEYFVKEK